MRFSTLTMLVVLCFAPIYSFAKEFAQEKAWTAHKTEDPMSNKSSTFLNTYGTDIRGMLNQHYVGLQYSCDGTIMLYTSSAFEIDDYDCNEYGCSKTQFSRIKVDENESFRAYWDIYEDGGMSLSYPSYGDLDHGTLLDMLKRGNKLMIQVKTMNTRGDLQYPIFSLSGFTKALRYCKK